VGEIAATAAVFEIAAIAGLGRLAAGVVVIIDDGEATSAFPHKTIQNKFASVYDGNCKKRSS
jgi:hypothetical protein